MTQPLATRPTRPLRSRDGSVLLFAAITCWLAGVLWILGAALFAWGMKDGMGPNSVESHGWQALSRFYERARGPLLMPTAIFLVGCLFYMWDVRRSA